VFFFLLSVDLIVLGDKWLVEASLDRARSLSDGDYPGLGGLKKHDEDNPWIEVKRERQALLGSRIPTLNVKII